MKFHNHLLDSYIDNFNKGDIFNRITYICSITTICLGLLAIIGWLINLHFFGMNYVPTRMIAFTFILLGFTWFLYINDHRKLSKFFVILTTIFILIISTGIDQPFIIICFILDCVAMILLLPTKTHRMAKLSGGISFIVISINLTILLGYLYGAPLLYGGGVRPVPFPVGVGFVVVSIGILASAGPNYSLLQLIVGPSVRSLLLRSFLLVISVVALTDGLFYNILTELNLRITLSELQALSALIYMTSAIAVVLRLSNIIGNVLYRSEKARKQAEDINRELQQEISNRKKIELQLKERAEELTLSNKELEQYAYVASHDIQEPLRMIKSFAQLLEERYKGRLDKDADEFISYIVDGATRMQIMINDLLTYSRIGLSKSLEPIDFEKVLKYAMDNLKIAIDESGAIVTHDHLPTINSDAIQMVTLFQNLLSNAIKFSRGTPHIHVSAKQRKNEWIFSVRDYGIGIAPEYIERIFNLFYHIHSRKDYPGTGIGLATCKKIIERNGGKIWVESKSGKGSTFYFTISIKDEKNKSNN